MSGPHNPNPNFPPPMPGPGNLPPQQYPQPNPYGQPQAYGNMPPQYNAPPQQPGLSPDAYLNGQAMYPPGFNAHEVPLWDPNSPDGTTRPVSAPVAAGPPRVGHKVVRNVASGRYIHEERAHQKGKAARENYTQRGSEQFFGALPKFGRFMGRVALYGTTTPPERRYPGHNKEVGWSRRLLAGAIGAVAVVPAVVSKGILMPIRFSSNYISLGRTLKDSLRTVVAKENEAPHQLRGNVPAQSVYTNPHPKLGGNLPTSNKQNRANNRKTRKTARQTPPAQQAQQPQQQRRRQTQQRGGKKSKSGRTKEKGF